MKRKLVLLFIVAIGLATSLVSCSKEEVAGIATYQVNLFVKEYSSFVVKGSDVDILKQDYDKLRAEITKKYAKEWQYTYSGETLEKALADEDRKAVANFDVAVAEYEALVKALKNEKQDLKGGSFKDVLVFKVVRNGETVKESKDLVFEYPSK